MKTQLTVNDLSAQFYPETVQIFVNGVPQPKPDFVEVCAWCDTNKQLTKHLQLIGCKVSHGICEACRDKFFGERKD